MSEKQTRRDRFAQIAAENCAQRLSGLIEPAPLPVPKRRLPLAGAPAVFAPGRKMETAQELRRELARMRSVFQPFLRNLAPAPHNRRLRLDLRDFDWRLGTDRDARDQAAVFAGRGHWERVRIPHYGGPLGRATAYYRTSFRVTRAMLDRRAVFVSFGGVDYKARVFVNGGFVGSHEGFFAPFEFDITTRIHPGANTLLVEVQNDAVCMGNNSWGADGTQFEGDKIYAATGPGYDEPDVGWHHCPPGMGIYQDVFVEARSRLFVSDVFVRPLPEQRCAEAWLEVWNTDTLRRPIRLSLSLFGQNFRAALFRDRAMATPDPMGPGVNYLRFRIPLPRFRWWTPDAPWLYQLQARLLDEKGRLLDTAHRQFGMRSFRMDEKSSPKGKLYLNGQEVRLRGANTMGFEQQDVMRRDWAQLRDDILLAKICHMNFWRLTQRPVQPEVYDFCDRLGLMTQTDLPLFGVLRRNQFCEAVRQAEEMERLVRSHPCNVLASFINEPFAGAGGKAHRHLLRHELESFFRAATEAVHLANPDRQVKAVDGDYDPPGPGLPDNHCYCCWYNGHGVEIGKLHKGYWQKVKPGWQYACGEFGAEGLDPVSVMRARYPKHWLPQTAAEESSWSPNRIVRAQTGQFHYAWFDTPRSLADWARASQAHQAWATRLMTEAFRRDNRMNSFAIHLFIDAFPSGWMKAIVDCNRRPKPAFFAYREALTPLMVNLRADRFAFFGGETVAWEAWICNDTHEAPAGAVLAYSLEADGRILAGGEAPARAPRCSSACQGLVRFALPKVEQRTAAAVRLALRDARGCVLHETAVEIGIFPRPSVRSGDLRAAVLDAPGGKAVQLARDLGIAPWSGRLLDAQAILIGNMAAFHKVEREVRKAVARGAVAVFLELPEGKQRLGPFAAKVKNCGMGPTHFVSRASGHPLTRDFQPFDFRLWYDAALDRASPLLERSFEAKGWTPVLTTGHGGWSGNWEPALAAAEKGDGCGAWRVCNVRLAGRIQGNPVAEIFSRRLLTV